MVLEAVASFFVCALAILALRPLAKAVDLIDRPGGRKSHHGEVPVVGGLAMFIGVVLGIGLGRLPGTVGGAYLAACAIVVAVGLVDDRFNLSPWTRLPGQIAATLVLIAGAGVAVTSLGNPFALGPITLAGYASVGFTVLVMTAAINAFNMLDGLDGLAGSVSLVSLLGIGYLSWTAGLPVALSVSLVLVGAICAFLMFNSPIRLNRGVRCFMGDAGSTLLGLSIAWLCVEISQNPRTHVSAVTTLWLVAVPLYELLWSTARRIVRGVSPFQADRDHFHHLLLKAGFGVRGASLALVAVSAILSCIGLALDQFRVADSVSFLMLVVFGVATISLMYRATLLWLLLPKPRPSVELPAAAPSRPGLTAAGHVHHKASNRTRGLTVAVLQGNEPGARDRQPPARPHA
ncbi:MAG: undecaprenyl/decaprenyl-phosphate alpha-N-acetylglucosaminyl 1-phosphate transferase [Gammaproteobacteria bacterium]|nr:undecaprenyl/decaprenyl-phosphate alpha-N-acetylglucosaminyl 1-phosphate transferase [Gammaproteobacteria bacterium]